MTPIYSSERSMQVLILSKSNTNTLWKYSTAGKNPAFKTLLKQKYESIISKINLLSLSMFYC